MYSVMGTAESVFIEALIGREDTLEMTDKYGNNVMHYVALYDRPHLVSPMVTVQAINNEQGQSADKTSIELTIAEYLRKAPFTMRESIHHQRFDVELEDDESALELVKLKEVTDSQNPKVSYQINCRLTNHYYLGGRQSCNLNARNHAENTPLAVAVLSGNLRTVKALLKWKDLSPEEPLCAFTKMFSCEKSVFPDDAEIAQHLLSYYIQRQIKPAAISMGTLMEDAKKNGKVELMEELVPQLSDFFFFTHHYGWCVSSSSFSDMSPTPVVRSSLRSSAPASSDSSLRLFSHLKM